MRETEVLPWYSISNIDAIDTPALIVFPERVKQNIQLLTSMVSGVEWLRPHVKTHKMAEVSELLLEAGITKFKCATIAEAEMLGQAGAPDVLLAYQPVGPKIERLLQLVQKYPNTAFSCIVDNLPIAQSIAATFAEENLTLPIFLDLNVGMNRTGIVPGPEAMALYRACYELKGIKPVGLHAYDGHLRDPDLNLRKTTCDAAFAPVSALADEIAAAGYPAPIMVAGGSPTFPIHAQRPGVECSPGTFVFWDYGYSSVLTEQPFQFAAVVVTRVISKIDAQTLCLDLGHKAIAAENPLPRVIFLNAPDAQPISQSEEHLVVKVKPESSYLVGDVVYGIPVHICPTCALYDKAYVAEENTIQTSWAVVSRNRFISV
ncbi:D-TA family PLP-dependent enzyme [Adhaeribacter radiodurans]|uniref:D-TA family PLP-dependent enzyme n=1 Tax=Adhaeribacter radiodurans TaxID=2745197 RepID=A0A7L7L4U2_9BACT|nr:D-TA family PLP-dependent enzyme [Adhaeribacter radiodurans]QMU27816.1 D-TA family PLP-dependent enzyme [Adhaeribacter radiodurans]